jgi:hypothetical protein
MKTNGEAPKPEQFWEVFAKEISEEDSISVIPLSKEVQLIGKYLR